MSSGFVAIDQIPCSCSCSASYQSALFPADQSSANRADSSPYGNVFDFAVVMSVGSVAIVMTTLSIPSRCGRKKNHNCQKKHR